MTKLNPKFSSDFAVSDRASVTKGLLTDNLSVISSSKVAKKNILRAEKSFCWMWQRPKSSQYLKMIGDLSDNLQIRLVFVKK